MNEILAIFGDYIYADFIVTNIMLVYVLLKFFIVDADRKFKVSFNFLVAFILVYAFYKLGTYQLPRLITSACVSVAVYQWVIKWIFKKIER